MAKDNAIGKRIKIDKAQKNMLGAVAGASLILGVCLVFAVYFLKYIKFNSAVISEKDKAITGYSNAIEKIGICKKPSGSVYNDSELRNCDPDTIDLSYLTGTLRHDIIVGVAQNEALESVGRSGLSICYNTSTNKMLTYDELYDKYRLATNDKDREKYLEMIGVCSSLRVIPDALPSSANALALGASLNRIFKVSQYEPDGITPGNVDESDYPGIGSISVNIEVESNGTDSVVVKVLNNLEKSIREINIRSARIEKNGGKLRLEAVANAYYTEPASLTESIEIVNGTGKVTKQTDSEEAI